MSPPREPSDRVARVEARGSAREQNYDALPDVRDGLTRLERAILHELDRAQRELAQRDVPSTLLYGRVLEHVNVGPREFQRALTRLARRHGP